MPELSVRDAIHSLRAMPPPPSLRERLAAAALHAAVATFGRLPPALSYLVADAAAPFVALVVLRHERRVACHGRGSRRNLRIAFRHDLRTDEQDGIEPVFKHRRMQDNCTPGANVEDASLCAASFLWYYREGVPILIEHPVVPNIA